MLRDSINVTRSSVTRCCTTGYSSAEITHTVCTTYVRYKRRIEEHCCKKCPTISRDVWEQSKRTFQDVHFFALRHFRFWALLCISGANKKRSLARSPAPFVRFERKRPMCVCWEKKTMWKKKKANVCAFVLSLCSSFEPTMAGGEGGRRGSRFYHSISRLCIAPNLLWAKLQRWTGEGKILFTVTLKYAWPLYRYILLLLFFYVCSYVLELMSKQFLLQDFIHIVITGRRIGSYT